jgi:hypothetical protein
MKKLAAYLAMGAIVLALLGADAYLLTRSEALGRFAEAQLRQLFGEALTWSSVEMSLDGKVVVRGASVSVAEGKFRPLEANRVEVRMRGLRVDGVTIEGGAIRLSDRLLEELSKGERKRSVKDLFPDGLPSVEIRGPSVEVSLPVAFGDRLHTATLRSLKAMPLDGTRVHLVGRLEDPLFGTWEGVGVADLDTGALELTLRSAGLQVVPAIRDALAEHYRDIYDKYRPGGLADVTVRLVQQPGKELDVRVTLHARDMQLRYRNFPYAVERAAGEIDFFAHGFQVKNMTGRHGPGRIRFDGRAEGYEAEAAYAFRIEADDLPLDAELRAALDPGGQKVWDLFRPEGRVSVRGKALREAGLDKPSRIPLDLVFADTSLVFREFPYPLRGVSGEVSVDGNDVTVKRLGCADGGMSLRVSGTIGDITGEADVDVTVEARGLALDDRLRKALPPGPGRIYDDFAPSGRVDVRWNLRQEKGKAAAHFGRAQARGVSATYREVPLPVTGIEGEIEITPGRTYLRHLTGKAHGSTVSCHGTVTDDLVDLEALDATGLPLDGTLKEALPEDIRWLLEDLKLGGLASFHSNVKLRTGGQKEFTLDLRLTKGTIDVEPRFEDLEGTIQLVGVLGEKPMVQGPLFLNRATIWGKRVTDLAASLLMHGRKLTFSNIKGTAYGGVVSGKSVTIDVDTKEFFGTLFTADRLDLGEWVKDTAAFSTKAVAGKVTLEVRDLTGRTEDAGTLKGKGQLQIRDALLWDIPVFLSLFQLNFDNLFASRNQFEAGAVEFEIAKRQFDVKHLAFTSESLSVVGSGRLGFDGRIRFFLRPLSKRLVGIDFFILNWAATFLSWFTGGITGVEVTGTFEKPETSIKPFQGFR